MCILYIHWDGEPTYQLFILCAAQSDTRESISPSFSPAGITGGAVMGHTTLALQQISMLLLFWPGGIMNVPQCLLTAGGGQVMPVVLALMGDALESQLTVNS